MPGRNRLLALAAGAALVVAACNGPTSQQNSKATSHPVKGGVLRIGLVSDVQAGMDPAREYSSVGGEFLHCCIARTLLLYKPTSPTKGGNELAPDLASELPTASSDGLTWIFKIRAGVRYAYPFENVTVTARDFIRALLREASSKTAAAYPFYYSDIEGFQEATSGKATSISGVSAPDPQTLQVKLIKPIGYFPYVWTLPAMSPIPPSLTDLNAPLGAATGHDQTYGQFVVSTGPYMFKGAAQTDYSKPPAQQREPIGYQAGKSYALVRNPSWDPAKDPLRKAYVDEIDVTVGGVVADYENKIAAGELDGMDSGPDQAAIRRFQTSPTLRPFIHSDPYWGSYEFSMNLATPPFDDIHVRKAVNWVVDKAGLLRLGGGTITGQIATHVIPNTMLPGLQNYDPYRTAGESGDVSRAKGEMKLSKYDANRDGLCDAAECRDVLMAIGKVDIAERQAALLQQNLALVGITIRIQTFQPIAAFTKCATPSSRIALCPLGWSADFGDPYAFVTGLVSSASLPPACCNISALGATSEQLRSWGYTNTTPPPSVDSQLNTCLPARGIQREQCYENIDRYLMEEVAYGIPYEFSNSLFITSARVRNYSMDPASGWISLSLIALANGRK